MTPDAIEPVVLVISKTSQLNPAMVLGAGRRLAMAPIGESFQVRIENQPEVTWWIKTGNGPDGAITCMKRG